MKKAFTYMFNDDSFYKKIFPVFILEYIMLAINFGVFKSSAILNQVLLYLGFMISSILLAGYFVLILKSFILQNDKLLLIPTFNIIRSFKVGFKQSIAWLLLYIIGVIIFLLVLIPVLFLNKDIMPIVLTIIFVLAALFFSFYLLALLWIFAVRYNFTSFLKFGLASKIIALNPKKYICSLFMIGFIYVIGALLGTLVFLFKADLVSNLLVIFILSIAVTYLLCVSLYILSKAIEPQALDILNVQK